MLLCLDRLLLLLLLLGCLCSCFDVGVDGGEAVQLVVVVLLAVSVSEVGVCGSPIALYRVLFFECVCFSVFGRRV